MVKRPKRRRPRRAQGPAGPAGPPGPPGPRGPRGPRGTRGGRRSAEPAGGDNPVAILEKLDREMGEMHRAMETQLVRIGQIQQQLDELRARFDSVSTSPSGSSQARRGPQGV